MLMSWKLIYVIRQTCSSTTLPLFRLLSCRVVSSFHICSTQKVKRVMKNYFYARIFHFPYHRLLRTVFLKGWFMREEGWEKRRQQKCLHTTSLHERILFPFTSLKCKLMGKNKFSSSRKKMNKKTRKKRRKKIRDGRERKVSSDSFVSYCCWCCRAYDLNVNVSLGKRKNIIPSSYLHHICMNVYVSIIIIYFHASQHFYDAEFFTLNIQFLCV